MRSSAILFAVLLGVPSLSAETPLDGLTAGRIMRKVAWHQNRAQTMREAFRYQQSVLVRFHKGKKLWREELFEYDVRPTPRGTEKECTHFLGKYVYEGELANYYDPEWESGDIDIDGELITELADELTNDEDAKDGLSRDLFPLTMQRQKSLEFELAGTETYKGREVYRILFEPIKKKWEGGTPWAGEALIDTEKLQPVLVTTHLAKNVPLVVRTLLGTNIKHLGFKVAYEEFEDDLWFPVSYGGEFTIRAVFLYKRDISISLRNVGFERSKVTSKITFTEPEPDLAGSARDAGRPAPPADPPR